jgi:hypothetical protein
MFDQLSAEIPASLIKGFLRTTTTTTKQNVDPAVHFVYSRVKTLKSYIFTAQINKHKKNHFLQIFRLFQLKAGDFSSSM